MLNLFKKKDEYSIFKELHTDEDYLAAFYANVISMDDLPSYLRRNMNIFTSYFEIDALNYFNLPLRERKYNLMLSEYGLGYVVRNYGLEQTILIIKSKDKDEEYWNTCKMLLKNIVEDNYSKELINNLF